MNNATTAPQSAWAKLGCVIFITPPPDWQTPEKRYWQIEVKDPQGKRFTAPYRTKDPDMADSLAQDIANERGLPIMTREPPKPCFIRREAPLDLGDTHDLTPQEAEADTPLAPWEGGRP